MRLRQPGFLEARTSGVLRPALNVFPLLVEVNPPAGAPVVGYVEAKAPIGLERTFLGKLFVALNYTVQVESPFSYVEPLDRSLETVVLSFPELLTHLDLRDSAT